MVVAMNWRCVYLRIDPQGGWMDDRPLFRVGVGLCVRWMVPWTVVDGWISTAQAEAARNASAGGRAAEWARLASPPLLLLAPPIMRPVSVLVGHAAFHSPG